MASCPECGVNEGARHARDCGVARCAVHGEQFIACSGEGEHRPSLWQGAYPGAAEALERGWLVVIDGVEHPDVNRVITELSWDASSETYR